MHFSLKKISVSVIVDFVSYVEAIFSDYGELGKIKPIYQARYKKSEKSLLPIDMQLQLFDTMFAPIVTVTMINKLVNVLPTGLGLALHSCSLFV
jgi:hypothetical protein